MKGAIDQLNGEAVGGDPEEVMREISVLSGVMGAMSEPDFIDKGIGTYVLAANAKIGALTLLYKQAPDDHRSDEYKRDLLATIDEALIVIRPFADKQINHYVEEKFECRRNKAEEHFWDEMGHDWHLYEVGSSESITARFRTGNKCTHVRLAYIDLVINTDWRSDHGSNPPTLCKRYPCDGCLWSSAPWYLYIRSNQPFQSGPPINKVSKQDAGDIRGEGNVNYTPIVQAALDEDVCRREEQAVIDRGTRIQSHATEKVSWFHGYRMGWANLQFALLCPPESRSRECN